MLIVHQFTTHYISFKMHLVQRLNKLTKTDEPLNDLIFLTTFIISIPLQSAPKYQPKFQRRENSALI